MVSAKGEEKVSDSGGKGKRKWSGRADDNETDRKRKNPSGVLRFPDYAAYEVDEDSDDSDDDMFDLEDFEDEYAPESHTKNEPGKAPSIPKEEVMNEEEFERMMEERYIPGAGFVTHAEDTYDRKRLFE